MSMAKPNIVSRVIVLIVGLGLACGAVWSGSEYKELHAPFVLTAMLGIIFTAIGGFLLGIFGKELIEERELCIDTVVDTFAVSLCPIFIGFIFGAIVTPFRSGAGFGAWITPWDFLLILGFLPTIFAVRNIYYAIYNYRIFKNY